jgi:hypothetical protein
MSAHTVTSDRHAGHLHIAVITGSTRPGRQSDTVARWALEIAAA